MVEKMTSQADVFVFAFNERESIWMGFSGLKGFW